MNAECIAVLHDSERSLALASALTLVERTGARVETMICCCKLRRPCGLLVHGCMRLVARRVLAPLGFYPDDDIDRRVYRLITDHRACECMDDDGIPF